MPDEYWHATIERPDDYLAIHVFDKNREWIQQRIADPWASGQPSLVAGQTIDWMRVMKVRISRSVEPSSVLIEREKLREQQSGVIAGIWDYSAIENAEDHTDEFLTAPAGQAPLAQRSDAVSFDWRSVAHLVPAVIKAFELTQGSAVNTDSVARDVKQQIAVVDVRIDQLVQADYLEYEARPDGRRWVRPTQKALQEYRHWPREVGEAAGLELLERIATAAEAAPTAEQPKWQRLQDALTDLGAKAIGEIVAKQAGI